MKKNIKFILITILLVTLLSLSLVGCAKSINLKGGDPNATTTNNNSLVVTQGDYIYFVNGKIAVEDIAEKKDNKYGNVIKSAIYRAKKDGTGTPEELVPQVAMDANNSNGISVLGNYLYFTSPSTATGKDGSLLTKNTDFYRVEISGKKLEKLVTLEGNTNQYKFTDKGLIYYADSKLTYLPYKGKEKVIAENISNMYFPVTSTYRPGTEDATMAVYYTESPEKNDGNPYNDLKCVTSSGEVKTLLSGKDSETTYSIKSVESEGNDGTATMYYEKTVYDKNLNENKGLFGTKLNSKFEESGKEKIFALAGETVRYIDYETGVYVFDDDQMFIPTKIDTDADEYPEDGKTDVHDLYTNEDGSGSLSASNIFAIREENVGEETKRFMYFFSSNALLKVEIIDGQKTLGIAEIVIKENIVTDYVKPVLDGNTFYYINSKLYNYIYKFDVAEEGAKHTILGVRTSADRKSYVNYVKGLDDDDRKKHDELIKEDLPAEELKKED